MPTREMPDPCEMGCPVTQAQLLERYDSLAVEQGDPLGPLYCALVLARVVVIAAALSLCLSTMVLALVFAPSELAASLSLAALVLAPPSELVPASPSPISLCAWWCVAPSELAPRAGRLLVPLLEHSSTPSSLRSRLFVASLGAPSASFLPLPHEGQPHTQRLHASPCLRA